MQIQIKIDVDHFIQNTPDSATAVRCRCRPTCAAPAAATMKKNPSVSSLSNAKNSFNIQRSYYFSFVQFERLSRFADSRLAKSEFLHDEERRDEAIEVIEAIEAIEAGNNEASLKLTAAAEEADEGNIVANKSNLSGPTNISIITVFMLTFLIV